MGTHFLECDIPKEESVINKIFPGNGFKARICRFFLSRTLISESSRASKLYMRSTAAIDHEKVRHLSGAQYRHIIHPYSRMWIAWASFIACLTAFSMYELPMRVAFNYLCNGSVRSIPWMCVGFIIDIIYLTDIGLKFITGYVSKTDKEIVLDPWRIARNYLRFDFEIDIISSVPMDVIFYISTVVMNDATQITYLVFNSFHLFKIFKIRIIRHHLLNLGQVYGINRYLMYRVFMLYAAILVLHWSSCLQYITAVVKMYSNNALHSTSWVSLHKLWDKSTLVMYVYALYRGTSLVLGLSFGDVAPTTTIDIFLAVTTRIVGAVTYAIVTAHYVHIFSNIYRTNYESADKMKTQLTSYLNHKQVPPDLKNKVFNYFNYRYTESYYKERNIKEALTTPLLQDILDNQAKKIAENVPFFHGLPINLLTDIVSRMTDEQFWPNDVIIRANTTGDRMYFLSKGTVAVYTPTGKEICHLQDGAYFGEIALVREVKRVASVVAIEPCETFRLNRADFISVIDPNSETWKLLEAEAQRRLERTQRTDEQTRRTLLHGTPFDNNLYK